MSPNWLEDDLYKNILAVNDKYSDENPHLKL